MAICKGDCFNCIYEDCVRPDTMDISHLKASIKYNESHSKELQEYRKKYYQSHKEQFDKHKKNYYDSLQFNENKRLAYLKKKSEYNRRYREKKKKEKEMLLCLN